MQESLSPDSIAHEPKMSPSIPLGCTSEKIEDIPKAEILAGRPLYIQNRYLEEYADRFIGPFAPSIPTACQGGGRSYQGNRVKKFVTMG